MSAKVFVSVCLLSACTSQPNEESDSSRVKTDTRQQSMTEEKKVPPTIDAVPTPDSICAPDLARDDLQCAGGSTVACNGRNVSDGHCMWKTFCDGSKALLLPDEAKPVTGEDYSNKIELRINEVLVEPAKYLYRPEDGTLIFLDGDGPAKNAAIDLKVESMPVAMALNMCD